MTIQQLRAQIAALQDATMDENRNFRSAYDEGKFDALSAVDALLDSLQEEPQVKKLAGLQHVNETCKENGNSLTQEPVCKDLEEAADNALNNVLNTHEIVNVRSCLEMFRLGTKWQEDKDKQTLNEEGVVVLSKEESVSEELEKVSDKYSEDIESDYSNDMFDRGDIMKAFEAGAKWQREKDESTTEDLGKYINELSKQFPEVSFAKLSRIAVRVAKWKEERFEKNRLAHCDALTEEQAQIESDFVTKHLKENSRTPTFIDAIEYGIKMQEEQMMAKAIDAHCFGFQGAALFSFRLPADNHLVGSEVKVIVVEERNEL